MTVTCNYCGQTFAKAATLNTHYCNKMQRVEYLQTNVGKIAFKYYMEWHKLNKRHMNITPESFVRSRFFSSFVKFIQFANAMLLPDKMSFIRYMIAKDMPPNYWSMDSVYLNYMQNLDETFTPHMQATQSHSTLVELASVFGCQIHEVFSHLHPADCIRLLKARKLSPWLLLFSKRFFSYLSNKLTPEQRVLIEHFINPGLWKVKFEKNPQEVAAMRRLAEELNL